jgi:hypothetical protein
MIIKLFDLPKDLIIEIIEYFYDYWSNIHKRNSIWCLYATCKKFKWLKNLELLYVEKNEIDFKIFRLTIGGVNNGTSYQFVNYNLTGIMEFNNGKKLNNTYVWNSNDGKIRNFNGILYNEPKNCRKIQSIKNKRIANVFMFATKSHK